MAGKFTAKYMPRKIQRRRRRKSKPWKNSKAADKEIAKVEKSADNAKVTMRHFEDAIKKVREQKDLKIGQKVELSAFR